MFLFESTSPPANYQNPKTRNIKSIKFRRMRNPAIELLYAMNGRLAELLKRNVPWLWKKVSGDLGFSWIELMMYKTQKKPNAFSFPKL